MFGPNIRYFVAILRFVAILTLLGRLWAKKVFFGVKALLLGEEVHYYMVCIAYFTELNSQLHAKSGHDYSNKVKGYEVVKEANNSIRCSSQSFLTPPPPSRNLFLPKCSQFFI